MSDFRMLRSIGADKIIIESGIGKVKEQTGRGFRLKEKTGPFGNLKNL